MEFKLGATRFVFSFGFFAVVALYMLFDSTGAGLPALCAIALHELGHILMMRLTGAQIIAMRFYPFGVQLEKRGLLTYGKEAAVYIGGPLMNAVSLALTLPWSGWNLFAFVSAALLLFNLLPVGRLDGGQLLRIGLLRLGGVTLADRVQKCLSFLVLAPLFAGGFYTARQGNFTLLFTAGYLAATFWKQ